MTGWRMGYGYATGPGDDIARSPHYESNSCTASFYTDRGNRGVARAARLGERYAPEFKERLRRDGRRALIIKRIFLPAAKGRVLCVFPNIKATGWPSKKLADALLDDAGVAALSGTAFGTSVKAI